MLLDHPWAGSLRSVPAVLWGDDRSEESCVGALLSSGSAVPSPPRRTGEGCEAYWGTPSTCSSTLLRPLLHPGVLPVLAKKNPSRRPVFPIDHTPTSPCCSEVSELPVRSNGPSALSDMKSRTTRSPRQSGSELLILPWKSPFGP